MIYYLLFVKNLYSPFAEIVQVFVCPPHPTQLYLAHSISSTPPHPVFLQRGWYYNVFRSYKAWRNVATSSEKMESYPQVYADVLRSCQKGKLGEAAEAVLKDMVEVSQL